MAKTISEHRLVAALVLCLSGLALLPFNPLPSRVFGWEQLAGVYDTILADDFEGGNFKLWSLEAPENLRMFPASDQDLFQQDYSLDRQLISGFGDSGVSLMSGFTADGEPIFSIEARSSEQGIEVRAGAAVDGGSWQQTEWLQLRGGSTLGIEWQRGHALAQDGHVFLSVDGELRDWLTELDNDSLWLAATGMTQSGVRTLLIPMNPQR